MELPRYHPRTTTEIPHMMRSFGRLFSTLALVAAAATTLAFAQPAGQKKTYTIGLVAKSQNNPVFLAAKTGAEDAAKDLGKSMGVTIKIDWQTPMQEDAQKQAALIEQLV